MLAGRDGAAALVVEAGSGARYPWRAVCGRCLHPVASGWGTEELAEKAARLNAGGACPSCGARLAGPGEGGGA